MRRVILVVVLTVLMTVVAISSTGAQQELPLEACAHAQEEKKSPAVVFKEKPGEYCELVNLRRPAPPK